MTSLLEGAKRLATRRSGVDAQVAGLDAAVVAARGRLPDEMVDRAAKVVDRANNRLRLSADHTIVALAGATGSGKSSTFNALTGLELVSVGVRRPTTSWATACTWGPQGAGELLEWLGIPPRHQVVRDSMLDTGREARDLRGLVLLDLPDHDSTEVAHHLEVERLVALADLLVWVVDPQKYADAAIHERFLRPMADHRGHMMVVLNHIDEVPEDRREAMLSDLTRLLAADGLDGIPVLATSAKSGQGIDDLRRSIGQRVADKAAMKSRISVDVSAAATEMREAIGEAAVPLLAESEQRALREALEDAAGIPIVVDAVERASTIRSRRATGWPLVSWVSRLRPDPLKRLHLDLGSDGRDLVRQARSSIPEANQVQQARVEAAVRELADQVSDGLSRPWAAAVRSASVSGLPELADRLDRAVGATDLGVKRTPLWSQFFRVVQWLLLLAALGGAFWLAGLALADYLRLPDLTPPAYGGIALPTILLVLGLLGGVVVAMIGRVLVGVSARNRAKAAQRRLRGAVAEVAEDLVIAPLRGEIDAYRVAQEGVRVAIG